MSYAIHLCFDGDAVQVPRHTEGGTYPVGGREEAHLNITYNYNAFFCEHLDREQGLRWLYGKRAEDCISRLRLAVLSLGTERDEDYWKATPGNAGYALWILLCWATLYPDAVFEGA